MDEHCMYDACMSEIIQVRNVPKKVHTELVRQAKNAGLSLNKYLLREFERMARLGHNAEILARAHDLIGKVPTSDTVKQIHEGREERERELADRERRRRPR